VRRVPGTLGHMAQRLRGSFSDRRLAVVAALALLTLFTLAMLAARMAYTGTRGHGWLAWNLFLAWIPFALALLLYALARAGAPLRALVPFGLLWLVFFPNAPYLVTDLKHIGPGGRVPVLYDVLLLSAAAWTGLLLGLTSLFLVHMVVRRLVGAVNAWALVVAVLALSSFGIYLGRVQRWNSWDVVANPVPLGAQVLQGLAHPIDYPRPLGLTVLLTSLLLTSYLVLYSFARLSALTRD
jgi:uncharacterized membrane protein